LRCWSSCRFHIFWIVSGLSLLAYHSSIVWSITLQVNRIQIWRSHADRYLHSYLITTLKAASRCACFHMWWETTAPQILYNSQFFGGLILNLVMYPICKFAIWSARCTLTLFVAARQHRKWKCRCEPPFHMGSKSSFQLSIKSSTCYDIRLIRYFFMPNFFSQGRFLSNFFKWHAKKYKVQLNDN
jgi:hypothetical protein